MLKYQYYLSEMTQMRVKIEKIYQTNFKENGFEVFLVNNHLRINHSVVWFSHIRILLNIFIHKIK